MDALSDLLDELREAITATDCGEHSEYGSGWGHGVHKAAQIVREFEPRFRDLLADNEKEQ
jgi:hypothetical protein